MTAEQYAEIRASIPQKPGVYRYYDADDLLLYVGKAKQLRKRISNYFTKKKHVSARLKLLVRNIHRIETTVVDTERDALFLENSLIKKHQPKYNVALKDDKTYPYIVIKDEAFPRIFFTRKLIRDGSEYFGPYTSVQRSRSILDFIKKIYPIRTCNLKLTEENINAGKFKVCLEYHIKNCIGPCVGLQSKSNYDQQIVRIREILKGNLSGVISDMKERMAEFASELDFENAQLIKDKLDFIDTFAHKSKVVNTKLRDLDVLSIASDEKYAFVNYLKVNNGAIIQVHSLEMKKALEERDEDLLVLAYYSLQDSGFEFGKELLAPFDLAIPEEEATEVIVPKIGDKKKLLMLSTKNAFQKLREKQLDQEKQRKKQRINPVLEQIQSDFRLKDLPVHIECFDNSNFQGSHPVAACVVFRNGKPFKSEYRHYNIKTVEGPNDFASMEEVVFRRYKRLLEEDAELPQLVVIDGGKGQLSSAVKSLKVLGIDDKLTIVGIAKKLEEIYYPGDSLPMLIDKRSPSLKVIQQARNEAHRFAVSFHRQKRRKGTLKTELTEIKGIGPKTAQKLLAHFKSIKKLKAASPKEVEAVVGKKHAQHIATHFSK
ncbi:MAG: excinuclease ABC subunit UvrC [Saprospiraceae bacterium]|nr:excinuclease ABC subunit UvrC [Saprospiraceae bacterium]